MKAAAIAKYNASRSASFGVLRTLLEDRKIVSPPECFQAMLSRGVLFLNVTLTTGGGISKGEHEKFWRPVLRRILECVLEKKRDRKEGVLFVWWGLAAPEVKKYLATVLNAFQDVDVRHIDWCNPAPQGDKFCDDPPHFQSVNSVLSCMDMELIDWLPDADWLRRSGCGVMGEFIMDTQKLHALYMERLPAGLECVPEIEPITGVRKMEVELIVHACAPLGLSSEPRFITSTAKNIKSEILNDDEKCAVYMYTGNSLYGILKEIETCELIFGVYGGGSGGGELVIRFARVYSL